MGKVDGNDKTEYQTRTLVVQPGEIIVGVKIQEIGYRCSDGIPAGFETNKDKDWDEFHIGSIQF